MYTPNQSAIVGSVPDPQTYSVDVNGLQIYSSLPLWRHVAEWEVNVSPLLNDALDMLMTTYYQGPQPGDRWEGNLVQSVESCYSYIHTFENEDGTTTYHFSRMYYSIDNVGGGNGQSL